MAWRMVAYSEESFAASHAHAICHLASPRAWNAPGKPLQYFCSRAGSIAYTDMIANALKGTVDYRELGRAGLPSHLPGNMNFGGALMNSQPGDHGPPVAGSPSTRPTLHVKP
jgi:hypothetical protein